MPHCQKEAHNRAARSKKERQRQKQETAARKQRLREAAAEAEAEAALAAGKTGNIVAPVEGHGEYEVGYEPEPEYTRFNVKKRSKKHLRQDLRKRQLREQREEEERRKKQQEEEYRKKKQQQRELEGENAEEEEDEEETACTTEPILEYFVFICECCDKRYATKNQFLNHVNSKKHKQKCRIYEDLGLLVTHIELRGENGNEAELYNDDDDDDDDEEDNEENGASRAKTSAKENSKKVGSIAPEHDGDSGDDSDGGDLLESKNERGELLASVSEDSDEDSDSDSDDDYLPTSNQRRNVFAGFAAAGFSSSDDDSSEEDDDDDDEGDRDGDQKLSPDRLKDPPPGSRGGKKQPPQQDDGEDDRIDFDELIAQNEILRRELDERRKREESEEAEAQAPRALPFHETYDPDDYDANEQRIASVQHRLRKTLASRGVAPRDRSSETFDPLDAIAMGKTLLQEVLQANIEDLQNKLDAYKRHKEDCQLMARQFALQGGNSKALPAQYVRKQDAADNARRRANVHHAGSHYHMQCSRSMQFGKKYKGLMARHSSQGSRLQASRMAAKEMQLQQRSHAKQVTSKKKSQQKKRGEAGGSKKNGGKKGKGGGDD